jgi:hypothetical protein
MSYFATVYNVMIASPGDVIKERDIIREVLAEWNSSHSKTRNIVLMSIGWETHSVPEMGNRPQAIINKQILKDCDLLVGVFWTRIGTSTGEFDSGTIEEIEEHLKASKPAMLYFSNSPVKPDSVNPEQYKRLLEFKKSCQTRGLYQPYNAIDEFRAIFSKHIQQKMNQPEYLTSKLPNVYEGIMEPSNSVIPNLSNEAKSLLLETSKDPIGHIIRAEAGVSLTIMTNHKAFLQRSTNARDKALWEGVIEELEKNKLIQEAVKNQRYSFKLTRKGYEVVDLI